VGPKVQRPEEEEWKNVEAKEELEDALEKLNRVSRLVQDHLVQVGFLVPIYKQNWSPIVGSQQSSLGPNLQILDYFKIIDYSDRFCSSITLID
jgi:hypothetical protein